jgi:hypothetical protein
MGEMVKDLIENVVLGFLGVDGAEDSLAAIVVGQGAGLDVIGGEPATNDFGLIVGATASEQAIHEGVLADLQLEHDVEGIAAGLEKFIQRFRLAERAGKTVEETAALAIGFFEALAHDLEDNGVGHKLSGLDKFFSQQADGGLSFDGVAEHVAGGEVRNAEVCNQSRGLSSFAGTRRT